MSGEVFPMVAWLLGVLCAAAILLVRPGVSWAKGGGSRQVSNIEPEPGYESALRELLTGQVTQNLPIASQLRGEVSSAIGGGGGEGPSVGLGVDGQRRGRTPAGGVASLSGLLSDAVGAQSRFAGQMGQMAGNMGRVAQSGELPQSFQENFERGISGGVNRTMGQSLAGLASRGVLNSSALDRSNRALATEVADASARNYQSSYQTVMQGMGQSMAGMDAASRAAATPFQTQAGGVGQLLGLQSGAIQAPLGLYEMWRKTRYTPTQDTIVEQGK